MSILVLLWLGVGFLRVPEVDAHAELVETIPAANEILPTPPDHLEIVFNEPVTPVERQFRLFDSSQTLTTLAPHPVGSSLHVSLPDGLKRGSYVLAWRVISADGHPISGVLPFAIGERSATEIEVAPRLTILGCLACLARSRPSSTSAS